MKTHSLFFYAWAAVLLVTSAHAQTPWYITGNSGTSASTNFLGTTDNKPLVLRTNNVERMRITAAGKIGFGTTAPTTTFDLIGTFKAGGATGYCKIDSTGNFFFTGDGALRIQANKYCFKLAVGSKGGMYYDKDNKRFEFRDTFATRTFSVNFDGEGYLKGGLQLGNSTSTTAGTIRWTGTDFEGRTTTGWVSLTAGGGGGGANTSLSNLTTTSINQDLLPSATNTRNLGSSSLRWKDLHLHNLIFSNGTTQTTAFVPYTAGSGISISGTTITNTGDVNAADDANTTLSNLGTTSINQNLLPSANNTRNLGSSSLNW
ncbi:MAG: hypothetical protein NZM08_01685, partial [Chitinophagales bacterium]|nr:hypothetical protein [Chitinophagales bacterium]